MISSSDHSAVLCTEDGYADCCDEGVGGDTWETRLNTRLLDGVFCFYDLVCGLSRLLGAGRAFRGTGAARPE